MSRKKDLIHYKKQAPFYIRNKENLYNLIFYKYFSTVDLVILYKRPRREITYFLKLFGWADKLKNNFKNPQKFKLIKNLLDCHNNFEMTMTMTFKHHRI